MCACAWCVWGGGGGGGALLHQGDTNLRGGGVGLGKIHPGSCPYLQDLCVHIYMCVEGGGHYCRAMIICGYKFSEF